MNAQQDSKMLVQFQSDVLEGRVEDIHTFIQALAKEAGNAKLDTLFASYGFKTWYSEESFGGWRVGLARDLAKLCYDTERIQGLDQLLRRYSVYLLRLREGSQYHVDRRMIMEHFALGPSTSQINFITWRHVLLAGAKGETLFARKMWTYIQQTLTLAEADQESRLQTGVGLHENIAAQLRGQRQSDTLRIALDELRAKQDLLLAMGYHPSQALLNATKHAENISGLDLSMELNASPMMLDIPSEHRYLSVSALEQRFAVPSKGVPGAVFNKLLADYGMQTKLPDNTWQPTERALAERYCTQALAKNKHWSGYIWHWQLDFAARIVDWAKRAGRLGA